MKRTDLSPAAKPIKFNLWVMLFWIVLFSIVFAAIGIFFRHYPSVAGVI